MNKEQIVAAAGATIGIGLICFGLHLTPYTAVNWVMVGLGELLVVCGMLLLLLGDMK